MSLIIFAVNCYSWIFLSQQTLALTKSKYKEADLIILLLFCAGIFFLNTVFTCTVLVREKKNAKLFLLPVPSLREFLLMFLMLLPHITAIFFYASPC